MSLKARERMSAVALCEMKQFTQAARYAEPLYACRHPAGYSDRAPHHAHRQRIFRRVARPRKSVVLRQRAAKTQESPAPRSPLAASGTIWRCWRQPIQLWQAFSVRRSHEEAPRRAATAPRKAASSYHFVPQRQKAVHERSARYVICGARQVVQKASGGSVRQRAGAAADICARKGRYGRLPARTVAQQ
jgi:hypothetical protein